jgi:glutathione S-transferase
MQLLLLQEKRITFAEWPDVKPTTPFGQIPILQVGDTVAAQSAAIGE